MYDICHILQEGLLAVLPASNARGASVPFFPAQGPAALLPKTPLFFRSVKLSGNGRQMARIYLIDFSVLKVKHKL